jgi:hypothetical protein
MVHAACWAHARRKFFQAVELNPQAQKAVAIVAQIAVSARSLTILFRPSSVSIPPEALRCDLAALPRSSA